MATAHLLQSCSVCHPCEMGCCCEDNSLRLPTGRPSDHWRGLNFSIRLSDRWLQCEGDDAHPAQHIIVSLNCLFSECFNALVARVGLQPTAIHVRIGQMDDPLVCENPIVAAVTWEEVTTESLCNFRVDAVDLGRPDVPCGDWCLQDTAPVICFQIVASTGPNSSVILTQCLVCSEGCEASSSSSSSSQSSSSASGESSESSKSSSSESSESSQSSSSQSSQSSSSQSSRSSSSESSRSSSSQSSSSESSQSSASSSSQSSGSSSSESSRSSSSESSRSSSSESSQSSSSESSQSSSSESSRSSESSLSSSSESSQSFSSESSQSSSSDCPTRCLFVWTVSVDCSTNPATVGSVTYVGSNCVSSPVATEWEYLSGNETDCQHLLQILTVGECCNSPLDCPQPGDLLTPVAPDATTAAGIVTGAGQLCPNPRIWFEVWRATGTCRNSPCTCAFTITVTGGNPAFAYAIWYEGDQYGPQTVFSSTYMGTGYGCLQFFDTDGNTISGVDITVDATGTCDFGIFQTSAVIAVAGTGPQPVSNISSGFICTLGCIGPTHFYIDSVTMECHDPDYFTPTDAWAVESTTDSGCTIKYLFAHATTTSCCLDAPTPGDAPNPLLAAEVEADCGGCAADVP